MPTTGRPQVPRVVRDALPPVALALLGLTEVLVAQIEPLPAAALAAGVSPLPLLARRRAPVTVGLAAVAIVVSGALLGVDMNEPTVPIAVLLLACFGFGARCALLRAAVAACAALLLVLLAGRGSVETAVGPDALFGLVLVTAAFAAGRVVRARSEALDAAARGAEALAQAAREAAVAAERTRIARELHDLIAHSIGVMVVQAGAAEQVLEVDRDAARRAVRAVQSTGRGALEDTRRLLDLLRTAPPDGGASPQPGLRELAELAGRFPGIDLDLQLDQDLQDHLPGGAEVSVYRVVHEALTNVVKHSAGRDARVRVTSDDAGVVVQVDDGGPARSEQQLPGGHGIVGMRERVTLYGGQLRAGERGDGGFRVVARFPARGQP